MDLHEILHTYRTEDALSNDPKIIQIQRCFQGQSEGHSLTLTWPWKQRRIGMIFVSFDRVPSVLLYKCAKFHADTSWEVFIFEFVWSIFLALDLLNDLRSAWNFVDICVSLSSTEERVPFSL